MKYMSRVKEEREVIRDTLLSGSYDFEELTSRIFHFQYQYNPLYQQFCRNLGRNPGQIKELSNIPFLPIRFFKSHKVVTGHYLPQIIFKSSGTTESGRSQHMVRDCNLYEEVSAMIFEDQYGPLEEYIILALLPSYLEQGDSSLIYMIRSFTIKTEDKASQFYRYDFERLRNGIKNIGRSSKKIILWGVTYALLDFAESYALDLEGVIVMETGGMKGRREELLRSEVHEILKSKCNCHTVHSEYGMTEMLSQAYSTGNGIFRMGKTLKLMSYDVMDPLTYMGDDHTGRGHMIDLSNIDSCSFIATDDLIRTTDRTFEVAGRLDHSDIRGCNLMYL